MGRGGYSRRAITARGYDARRRMGSSDSGRFGPAARRSVGAFAFLAGVVLFTPACDHYAAAGAAPPSLTPAPVGQAQPAPPFTARGCDVPIVASSTTIEPLRLVDGSC